MQVKYTLTPTESKSLRQVFEDIPTDLCGFVECPDCDGDACENCPMALINAKWNDMLNSIHNNILPMIKAIEPETISSAENCLTSNMTVGGQMVRKMIEAYEGKK
jgi:hypothetical protein